MKAVIKPLLVGVATYIVCAVGLWFVLSYLLVPIIEDVIWLIPAASTLVPLFLSGHVAASRTVSRRRALRIAFGTTAGLVGFALTLLVTQSRGEVWLDIVLCLGAATVAAAGALIGTRSHSSGAEDGLAPYRDLSFMQSRIPAIDALSTFVPEGEESDPSVQRAIRAKGSSRWFPAEGGHKVLIPYEGEGFDHSRFTIEEKAWNHEHCKACGATLEPMTLCWVTESGPYVVLCPLCHKQVKGT